MSRKKAELKESSTYKSTSIPAKLLDTGELLNINTGEKFDPISVLPNADIYITQADTNTISNLATGIALPTYFKKSWDYLKDVQDFKDVPDSDVYKQIDVCNKLYRFEPVIGTAIDLFVDFAISNVSIKTDNEELNKLINYLYDNLNKFPTNSDYIFAYPTGLKALIKEITSEWFISGNVFPLNEYFKRDIDGKSYLLPLKTINLNPLAVKIEREPSRLGAVKITYSNTGYYATTSDSNGTSININNTNPSYTSNDLMSMINKNSETKLDHNYIYHIKRKYSGFKLWGIPYLTRTFTAVKAKRKLRYLDDATVDGLVNFLIIFKIGSDDPNSPYHKVSGSRLAAFEALIKNPQASNMIVWPHDIEIITAGPDGKVLDFKQRYEVVDRDIIRSLGAPPVLMDGTGGSSVSWLPILSLVERLEDVREATADYIRHFISVMAEKNKLEYNEIKIKWSPSNLRDEKTIKTLLLAFYDRGLLPIETTLEQANYDYKDALELKKKEKTEKVNQYFERPDIPFSPNKQQPNKNFNRQGDTGRPVDVTKTTNANNIVIGTFIENVIKEFNNIYEDIKDVRKIDNKIEDKILAGFVRIKNISDVYINMEKATLKTQFDKYQSSFDKWRFGYLDNIMNNLKSDLVNGLAYQRKEAVANFITAGVFSVSKDKLESYCKSIYNIFNLIDLFNTNINNNILYAYMMFQDKEAIKIELVDIFNRLPFENLETLKFKFIEE